MPKQKHAAMRNSGQPGTGDMATATNTGVATHAATADRRNRDVRGVIGSGAPITLSTCPDELGGSSLGKHVDVRGEDDRVVRDRGPVGHHDNALAIDRQDFHRPAGVVAGC